jgi:hypothetical protein
MSVPYDLAQVARRVVWFKTPEETLQDPVFFLAHVMTYGMVEDILTVKKHFTPEDFRRALEQAPPGVFDKRSWAYWNVMFDRWPVPPLPKRRFLTEEEAEGLRRLWPPTR